MTDIQKVQLLCGDSAGTLFTSTEYQAFLDLNGGSILLAAAAACDALSAQAAKTANSFALGDYSVSGGSNTSTAYANMAKNLRDLEWNTPAFAIAEDNSSDFNYYTMLYNYILRTEA